MNVTRMMILLLLGLIPLAGLRELWWSDVLFLRPWDAAGGDSLHLGTYAPLFQGRFASIWTILIGLFAGLVIDTLVGFLRRLTLPTLGFLALISASLIVGLVPALTWAALWPLFGFLLASMFWILAVLQVGRVG